MIVIQPRAHQYSVATDFQRAFRELQSLRVNFERNQNLRRLDRAVETSNLRELQQILPNLDRVVCHTALNEALISTILQADNPEIVSLLLDYGANIEYISRYSDDTTPLLFACMAGHLEAVKLLRERGADLTARDGYWNNALHVSAESGRANVAEFLIAIAPSLLDQCNYTEDGESFSPDEVALQRGHFEVAGILKGSRTKYDRCQSCQFFSDSSFLFCAVHPYLPLEECSDYKEANGTSTFPCAKGSTDFQPTNINE